MANVQVSSKEGVKAVGDALSFVNPKAFGAIGDGVVDDTNAFKDTIAYALAKDIPIIAPDKYMITSTLNIPKTTSGVFTLDGQGTGVFEFEPTADDIMFDIEDPAGGIAGFVFLKNFRAFSYDTTYIKTAIQITEMSVCKFENISIGAVDVWHDTSGGSIGLRTRGRDSFICSNVILCADKPLYLGKNPNTDTWQADHFHFTDMYLVCLDDDNSVITCENGLTFSNLTFDGYQTWARGVNGFYYNNTENTGITSSFLTIKNVRWEQTKAGGSGFTVVVTDNSTNPIIASVLLENIEVVGDSSGTPPSTASLNSANGISLRKVAAGTLINCSFPTNEVGRTPLVLDLCYGVTCINVAMQSTFDVTLTSMVTVSRTNLALGNGIAQALFDYAQPTAPIAPFLSGAGSPVGVVTPTSIGQDYMDTTGSRWWRSVAIGPYSWVQLTNYGNPAITATGDPNGVYTSVVVGEFFIDGLTEKVYMSSSEGGTTWIVLN